MMNSSKLHFTGYIFIRYKIKIYSLPFLHSSGYSILLVALCLQTEPVIIRKTWTIILHIRCAAHLFLTSRFGDFSKSSGAICSLWYRFSDFKSWPDKNIYIMLSVDGKKQLTIAHLNILLQKEVKAVSQFRIKPSIAPFTPTCLYISL